MNGGNQRLKYKYSLSPSHLCSGQYVYLRQSSNPRIDPESGQHVNHISTEEREYLTREQIEFIYWFFDEMSPKVVRRKLWQSGWDIRQIRGCFIQIAKNRELL